MTALILTLRWRWQTLTLFSVFAKFLQAGDPELAVTTLFLDTVIKTDLFASFYPACIWAARGRFSVKGPVESPKTASWSSFWFFFFSTNPLSSSCSLPSLWGHQTLRQFVLNLTTQMFLWVTDFYTLEKIISAFPEIVLLALEKKKAGDWKLWESLQLGRWEAGRRGFVLFGL